MRYSLPVLYLHGFASGPGSRKARYLADRFLEQGIDLQIPDLAEGNFENLTISAQLCFIERLVGGQPVSIIGSSLGGYLAALYAADHPEVDRLVLLAPAFGFLDLWKARLGSAEMARWQSTNQLAVYHYGDQVERNLGYRLMADAVRYPPIPDFPQPALILHGTADDTVPIASSREAVKNHPKRRLIELESDHELGNVLGQVADETARFILGVPLVKSVLG